MLRLLLALALALPAIAGMSGRAAASAWTLPQGEGLAIGTATYTEGTRVMRRDGNVTVPRYRKLESSLLLEYGMTDWLTGIATPSLRWTEAGRPRDTFFGLGYTDLGARARVWHDDRQVVSLQALARIPGAGSASRPAQAGNAEFEYDLRALYGRSFRAFDRDAFVNAEAAYRLRINRPDEVRADLTFGIRPAERWLLLAQSFTVVSNGERAPQYRGYWYTKAQLSVVYEFAPGWSIQAGAVSTYAGHRALQENGVLLALWRRF